MAGDGREREKAATGQHLRCFSGGGVENNLLFCDWWHKVCGYTGEKRGVAGLLLGRTERAARAAELQLCAQAR